MILELIVAAEASALSASWARRSRMRRQHMLLGGGTSEINIPFVDQYLARVAITGRNYFRDANAQEMEATGRAEADKQIKAMVRSLIEVIKILVYAVGKGLGAFVSAVVEKRE